MWCSLQFMPLTKNRYLLSGGNDMLLKRDEVGYIGYLALLILTGYIINYLRVNYGLFNDSGQVIWTLSFLFLTFSFKPARDLIVSKLNLKPFNQLQTYLYIAAGLILSYLIFRISVAFELFMDPNLIMAFKSGYLQGKDLNGIINTTLFTPIWEEIFFRGILLFSLLKFLKPILAIAVSSIIFALFHPMYIVVTFVSGIILAVIAIRTRSLVPGIIIHAVWNLYTVKLFLYFW